MDATAAPAPLVAALLATLAAIVAPVPARCDLVEDVARLRRETNRVAALLRRGQTWKAGNLARSITERAELLDRTVRARNGDGHTARGIDRCELHHGPCSWA